MNKKQDLVHISWPCLLLCVFAPIEVALSLRHYWFTEYALGVHLGVIRWTVWVSLAFAALLAAAPRLRLRIGENVEGTGRMSSWRHLTWMIAAFLGIFFLFFFLKYCQFRGFQLPLDSTATANNCFNIIHRWSYACPVLGVGNYFAVHFIPMLAVISPLLLIWNSLLPLIVLHVALAASLPVAVYIQAYKNTGSSLAGFAALWLAFTSPFLFFIVGASVHPGMYVSFFFVWAMVLAERGWKRSSAGAFLLMGLCIEQACVAFFGLGVYLVARMGVRRRRSWLIGGGVCVASIALFYLEQKYKYSFPEAVSFRGWEVYRHLGPTPKAAMISAVKRPWDMIRVIVWPPDKLKPLGQMFLSTGFLSLFQPVDMIPWAINYLPNFLAAPDDPFHLLILHYGGYAVGPLWWAATSGLSRAYERLDRAKSASWLLVYVLLIGAGNLIYGPQILLSNWGRAYFTEAPVLTAMVPSTASVWATEFSSPWVSARSFLKVLSAGGLYFGLPENKLFMPDYVFVDRSWIKDANQETHLRILTFLAREGYVKQAEGSQLILLRHPKAPLEPAGGEPPMADLPVPDALLAGSYGRALSKDDDVAAMAKFYRYAAERGDDQAQFNLGLFYYQGTGVPRDRDEAVRWWTLAAEQGYADAQNNLGLDYMARREWSGAVKWFREASAQGNAQAQYNLGICYAVGNGVPQDMSEAAKWFRSAAELGNLDAQYNMGALYLRGTGVPQDNSEALKWLGKAAQGGHEKAKKKFAELRH